MTPSNERLAPVWWPVLRWLAAFFLLAGACNARAACDIADSTTTDKPYTAYDVETSFQNTDCQLIYLDADTTFYRYYSFPLVPNINIGRYFTLDIFNINSEAIVKLALYPFPPNPQFQNFAYFREMVTVLTGIGLYAGIAGPQPAGDSGSCYAGGARQYFFAGDNISSNPSISFSNPVEITRDTRYPNQYGVGDPCNVFGVPEPATPEMLGLGLMVLATMAGIKRRARWKGRWLG